MKSESELTTRSMWDEDSFWGLKVFLLAVSGLALALLLLFATQSSASLSPVGGNFLITNQYNDNDEDHDIDLAAGNGKPTDFIAAWSQQGVASGNAAGVQMINQNGGRGGSSTPRDEIKDSPAVATNTRTGESVIVFLNAPGGIFQAELFAQRIGSGGTPVGGAVQLTTYDGSIIQHPTIAYNAGSNEYLVAWDQVALGDDYSDSSVYAMRLSTSGGRIGQPTPVSGVGRAYPEIASNPVAGEYMLTWQEAKRFGGPDIFGRRLDAGAEALGGEFQISEFGAPDARTATHSQIAFNRSSGTYLATWVGNNVPDREVPGCCEIYAQVIDGKGVPTGPDLQLSADDEAYYNSDDFRSEPALAAGDGEFLAVWSAGWEPNTTIEAQRIRPNGTEIGQQFTVSRSGGPPFNLYPEVAFEPSSSRYLVAWVRIAPEPSLDIGGQILSQDTANQGACRKAKKKLKKAKQKLKKAKKSGKAKQVKKAKKKLKKAKKQKRKKC